MLDRVVGNLAIETPRDKGEQVVAQIVEAGVEQDQHADSGAQRVQCRKSLVRHHLVDEQLEKDRHRQPDHMHRQGRRDDVAHPAALDEQLAREPR
jgi:hypothetical protein